MAQSLLNKLKRTTELPSPPGAAVQILRLCQRDDVAIRELADTVAADPALSLRLLKYANSAMVGVRSRVTSVREAVVLLGIRAVRLTALCFSLISSKDRRACQGFNYGQFWSHSVACGTAARYLAKQGRGVSPEEAFAAGVLAQIGKLIFAVCMPKEYAKILDQAGGLLGETAPLEVDRFGASHHELGAELLLEWGIPQELASPIHYQYSPDELTEDGNLRHLARMIRTSRDIADIVCQAVPDEALTARWEGLLASDFFDAQDQARAAVSQIREQFWELAVVFSLEDAATASPDEIQAEAGEVLSELSLAAQLKNEAVEQEYRGPREEAWTDSLTGIANRAAFDKHLAEAWEAAAQRRRPIGLVLLDLDHSKRFNDNCGHGAGDAVLRALGSCLAKAVRSADFVARYGGEEFAVILPNVDRLTTAQICVKIRKLIELDVVEFDGRQHRVTVSVGAVILPAVVGSSFTPELLIEAADKQLCRSKEKGRNCCSMTQLNITFADAETSQPAAV